VADNSELKEESRLLRDRVGGGRAPALWRCHRYQAAYEQGWAHSGRTPLVVSEFTDVYPATPADPTSCVRHRPPGRKRS
jgi:hypothetical protein